LQKKSKNLSNSKIGTRTTPRNGKETAIADMQKEIVKASQSVEIAQRTADATVKKQKVMLQA